eukprot:2244406-Pleurochrysis_carterae.AAC.1
MRCILGKVGGHVARDALGMAQHRPEVRVGYRRCRACRVCGGCVQARRGRAGAHHDGLGRPRGRGHFCAQRRSWGGRGRGVSRRSVGGGERGQKVGAGFLCGWGGVAHASMALQVIAGAFDGLVAT